MGVCPCKITPFPKLWEVLPFSTPQAQSVVRHSWGHQTPVGLEVCQQVTCFGAAARDSVVLGHCEGLAV